MLASTASLVSRNTTASAMWKLSYGKGSHPNLGLGGDRLYAASRLIESVPTPTSVRCANTEPVTRAEWDELLVTLWSEPRLVRCVAG